MILKGRTTNELKSAMSLPPHKVCEESRVSKGVAARASHRTIRDSLPSYGSCHSIIMH